MNRSRDHPSTKKILNFGFVFVDQILLSIVIVVFHRPDLFFSVLFSIFISENF